MDFHVNSRPATLYSCSSSSYRVSLNGMPKLERAVTTSPEEERPPSTASTVYTPSHCNQIPTRGQSLQGGYGQTIRNMNNRSSTPLSDLPAPPLTPLSTDSEQNGDLSPIMDISQQSSQSILNTSQQSSQSILNTSQQSSQSIEMDSEAFHEVYGHLQNLIRAASGVDDLRVLLLHANDMYKQVEKLQRETVLKKD